ncbi:unnamed protein product [Clonostachys byssicola]|uniref:2-dehydropantoate 2-reductase n=1 Tax=Clonostachys byssicola TaxID=160290 RepID=A0A9N9UKU8_9HYPO|nr:unnamed protein product [Clonostachys byssicola]
MTKSRVLLIGAGGIGTVCAYALEKGGLVEVTVVMRSMYNRAVEQGIDIDSVDFGRNIKSWRPTAILQAVPNVAAGESEPFEFIVVTTKNLPDAPPTVADIIAPAVVPGKTAIVLGQNGLNIDKPLADRFPGNPLISSVIFTGAAVMPSGTVVHSDPDVQRIGPFAKSGPGGEDAARRFVALYNPRGELDVTLSLDTDYIRWRKLAYNASFNAVAAVLQMDTSRMRMLDHVAAGLIIPAINEIKAAAMAAGVALQDDLVHAVMFQDSALGFFRPSMLQDYEKGNLMEIETIVGEPLRKGRRLGVPMPTLEVIYNMLQGLQSKVKENKGLWKADYAPDNSYRDA